MPVHFREALKGPWLVLVYADPYSMDDVERVMQTVLSHPRARSPLRLLIDRRYSTAPDSHFIGRLLACGERHREQFHGARVAVVVTSDVALGVARMVENLVELTDLPPIVRSFQVWDDAERWLASAPIDEQRTRTTG
jgi:hypothetical protein